MFAAASLTDAVRDVSAAWERAGDQPLRLSLGSSSTLALQVEQAAPADLFASADRRWMDCLAERNLIAPGKRRDLTCNRLVLIVPKKRARQVEVGPNLDLAALLGPAIGQGDRLEAHRRHGGREDRQTHLNYGQGASAELVAMATILAADQYGLPVSTTHVPWSGVAGIMAANGSGVQTETIRNIVLAWVPTLPCAILSSGTLYFIFSRIL